MAGYRFLQDKVSVYSGTHRTTAALRAEKPFQMRIEPTVTGHYEVQPQDYDLVIRPRIESGELPARLVSPLSLPETAQYREPHRIILQVDTDALTDISQLVRNPDLIKYCALSADPDKQNVILEQLKQLPPEDRDYQTIIDFIGQIAPQQEPYASLSARWVQELGITAP